MEKSRITSKAFIVLALAYLYIPIMVLMVMSFNSSRYNQLPFEFSLKWYQDLFHNSVLIKAAINSLWIAAVTGIICVILATLLVLGAQALSGRIKNSVQSIMLMPLTIPWLIIGLSILLMIRALEFDKNLFFVLAGHTVISLPYSVLVLQARIQSMDPALEEASASLGANVMTTFRRITLPVLAPAMVAGGFLSFMISFDNFVLSYFLMPSGVSTLPIEIQSSIKFGFTPEINAVSTIIIGISLLCLAIVGLIMGSSIKSIFGKRRLSMATVRVENLTKKYGDNTVLDAISLEIPEGTLVSLLGPSGCGKTTTLRLIAGFEQANGGDIYIGDQRVNDVKVHQRNIGMVFQSYALFPHMTVWDNVAYGLEQRRLPKNEINTRIKEVLKLVQLEGYEARKPKQLSGGQQQRVALARALVIQPKILLLDESLSALDKKLRVEMQVELRRILDASGITALFVTHDQEEALTLSDYIVVMDQGTIVQMGKPYEVYEAPKNRFVASFLGKSNFFEGVITEKNDKGIILDTSFGKLPLATNWSKEVGETAVYAIRPEKIKLYADKKSDEESISGIVQFVTYAGNISSYTIDCNGLQLVVEAQNAEGESRFKEGDQVFANWDPQVCLLMEDEVKK